MTTEQDAAVEVVEETAPEETTTALQAVVEKLQAPTPPDQIYYLPRGVFGGRNGRSATATAIPYIPSEFVENRLDEACGPFGWQGDIRDMGEAIACGLGIRDPETHEWVWRWDVGLEQKQGEHGAKAEVTGAIKRAARQWGIGRDLKDIPKIRVPCKLKTNGKFLEWAIDPNEAIAKFIQTGEGKSERAASTEDFVPSEDPATEEAAKESSKPKGEATPGEARKKVFDFLMSDTIAYTTQQANKWLIDQEREHGRTLESYRKMWTMLQKSHTPPTSAG